MGAQMKAFVVSAIASLLFFFVTPVSAQRSLGAQNFILDDGAGHTITLQTPAGGWTGNIPFLIPIPPTGNPPAGFVHIGTTLGQILEWNPADGVQGAWDATTITALGGITGSGTNGTIPKWTGSSTQSNSALTDDGTTLSYGGTHINSTTDYEVGTTKVLGYDATNTNLTVGDGMTVNTSGVDNTTTGMQAMTANTTGSHNTVSGFHAMNANTVGQDNSAFGYQ